MKRILVIEDDPKMHVGLRDNLEYEGYDVTVVTNGVAGLETMRNREHDLVILDVMLPKMSGFDVLRQARASGVVTPTIMLTAKGEEIDRVLGLELGADDYVTKPFSLRELLARVKAVLRRGEAAAPREEGPIALGACLIDFDAYTAQRYGKDVAMSAREFELLKYLWNHRNQTVTRDQLLEDVWGYNDTISSRTVDNFIVKLRQKVEQDPAHPCHIITIHGAGYKLLA